MADPLIVFPDAEQITIDYLDDALAPFAGDALVTGVLVCSRKPSPMPTESPVIVVRHVGGFRQTVVTDVARIDLSTYHADETQAQALGQLARGLVHQMPGNTIDAVVYRVVDFAALPRFADPDSDQARSVFTVEISIRGVTTTVPAS